MTFFHRPAISICYSVSISFYSKFFVKKTYINKNTCINNGTQWIFHYFKWKKEHLWKYLSFKSVTETRVESLYCILNNRSKLWWNECRYAFARFHHIFGPAPIQIRIMLFNSKWQQESFFFRSDLNLQISILLLLLLIRSKRKENGNFNHWAIEKHKIVSVFVSSFRKCWVFTAQVKMNVQKKHEGNVWFGFCIFCS